MKRNLVYLDDHDLPLIYTEDRPTPRQWFGLVLTALGICVVAYILVVAYLIALPVTPK